MRPDDKTQVKAWIKIWESAITSSDQKEYAIYKSMKKFKNFKKPGYIQKRDDESIERRMSKKLSEYHVVFCTKPIVEQLDTFDENLIYSDQSYLCIG